MHRWTERENGKMAAAEFVQIYLHLYSPICNLADFLVKNVSIESKKLTWCSFINGYNFGTFYSF